MDTKKRNGKGIKSFIIANPIYDTVFKKLMENKLIVKFFLSTIMERTVTDVTVLPQEFTIKGAEKKDSEEIPYSILRLDFMATVQTEGGRPEKVLIEVQKAWDKDDMMRFRKYLGEQYGKKESVNGRETTLPITTIYILGFNLDGMESPCVKVGRTYMDMRNRETIHAKSDFIEMLTHDSYVIQASRITDVRYTTNLDKLLSIFEQAYFVKDNSGVVKEYPYQPDDENMDIITSVLYGMAADPEARKRLEDEEETMRVLDVIYFSKIRERDKALEESDKALEEKNKALKEKDKVIEEKDKRIAELQRLLQNRPVE